MSATIPSPPNATTEVDIGLLPRWVAIGYVARCVRRAYRLLEATVPTSKIELIKCYADAIQAAEQSAIQGQPVARLEEYAQLSVRRASGQVARGMGNDQVYAIPLDEQLIPAVGNAAAKLARACLNADMALLGEAYEDSEHAALVAQSRVALQGMTADWEHLRAREDDANTLFTPEQLPTPTLRVAGLYIKNLRAIKKLKWPQDGLGWGDRVPDIVMLSGANGSGKTTLLEFILGALEMYKLLASTSGVIPNRESIHAEEAWIDFEVSFYGLPPHRTRLLIGDDKFVKANAVDDSVRFVRTSDFHLRRIGGLTPLLLNLNNLINHHFARSSLPSVVFLPSEERTLIVPPETFKAAGANVSEPEFTSRWQPPKEWKDTLEAVLYAMRWQDLNAREEGHDQDTNHFEAYAAAFRQFNGHAKELVWRNGELVVKLKDSSVTHDLNDLSSGEKQVLLLCGELLRRWRPGSLVMIDEPELHLHGLWQTKLYQALRYWIAERGGQVILATQSDHFFEMAEPKSISILGVEKP